MQKCSAPQIESSQSANEPQAPVQEVSRARQNLGYSNLLHRQMRDLERLTLSVLQSPSATPPSDRFGNFAETQEKRPPRPC